MKALIIRSRWLDLILSGHKTWEMRSRHTTIRGRIGLVRAGSGQVVATAELVDCLPPLDAQQMRQTEAMHGIPDVLIDTVVADGWTMPWVLRDIRVLAIPQPYVHRLGAVVWVEVPEIDESVAMRTASTSLKAEPVGQKVSSRSGEQPPAQPKGLKTASASRAAQSPQSLAVAQSVDIVLTQGNLNRHHIYLRSMQSLLPKDCIGGSNRLQPGRPITVTFEPGQTVETDVAGDKMILRARSPIRDFFERSGCEAGDVLRFTRISERKFEVRRLGRE